MPTPASHSTGIDPPEDSPNLIALQEARECLLRCARNYLALSGECEAAIDGEVAAGYSVHIAISSSMGADASAGGVKPLVCI